MKEVIRIGEMLAEPLDRRVKRRLDAMDNNSIVVDVRVQNLLLVGRLFAVCLVVERRLNQISHGERFLLVGVERREQLLNERLVENVDSKGNVAKIGQMIRVSHELVIDVPEGLVLVLNEGVPQLLVIAFLHVANDLALVLERVCLFQRRHVMRLDGFLVRKANEFTFREFTEVNGDLPRQVRCGRCQR